VIYLFESARRHESKAYSIAWLDTEHIYVYQALIRMVIPTHTVLLELPCSEIDAIVQFVVNFEATHPHKDSQSKLTSLPMLVCIAALCRSIP
jgi:hypothetical protein